MADSKRVSGRQIPSGTSGRAPAASSTSGRQPSGTSGRAAAPSGISPSGRMTASSGASGRAAPGGSKQGMTPAAPPRASVSSRSSRREDKPKFKRASGVGTPLMVCFGVLGLLGVVAGAVFVTKNSEIKKAASAKNEEQEKYESNIKLGFDYFAKAEAVGLLYCMGTEKDTILNDKQKMRDKLFAPFIGDDRVYNVLYERRFKDKKAKEKPEQEFLFPEKNRIDRTEKGELKQEIRVVYGFADNKTTPIVIASKTIKPAEGDQANLNGQITVMVKAQDDHIFKTTREHKPANAPGAPAAAPEKAPEPAK